MTEQHECEPLCETVTSFTEYAEEHGRLTLVISVPLLKAILPILNEYETLKKATERLSAEDALNIANGYALNQDHYNAMKAYADTLEGKDG